MLAEATAAAPRPATAVNEATAPTVAAVLTAEAETAEAGTAGVLLLLLTDATAGSKIDEVEVMAVDRPVGKATAGTAPATDGTVTTGAAPATEGTEITDVATSTDGTVMTGTAGTVMSDIAADEEGAVMTGVPTLALTLLSTETVSAFADAGG